MRRESFERFYFEKVALGEGCGCAEHVTRTRELNDLARGIATGRRGMPALVSWPVMALSRWLRRSVSTPGP